MTIEKGLTTSELNDDDNDTLQGFLQDDEQELDLDYSCSQTINPSEKTVNPLIITPLNMSNLPANILGRLQQQDSTNTLTGNVVMPSLLLSEKPSNLTADQRRQRRLWRNRLAAKACRIKKKVLIHDMEDTIQRLESENSTLRKQVNDLKEKVAAINEFPVLDENYRLMKQVEELNAKLGLK
jgi:hypothetical protein